MRFSSDLKLKVNELVNIYAMGFVDGMNSYNVNITGEELTTRELIALSSKIKANCHTDLLITYLKGAFDKNV